MDELADLIGSSIAAASAAIGGPFPSPEWIDGVGYISIFEQGVSFVVDAEELVLAIQLHGEDHEGFSEWRGPLPKGLTFKSGRSAARQLLGVPEQSGDAHTVPILGVKPAWDRFSTCGAALHLEYDDEPEAGIRMISWLPARKVS